MKLSSIESQVEALEAGSSAGLKSADDLTERIERYVKWRNEEFGHAVRLKTLNSRFGVASVKVGTNVRSAVMEGVKRGKLYCHSVSRSNMVLHMDFVNMIISENTSSDEAERILNELSERAE